MDALLVVVAIAGMFLLLIAPHEAGHFALAKLFKVRVIEFSVGAGARIWSTTRGGTLRSVEGQPITAPDQLRKIENAAPNAAIVVSGVHANGQAFTHIVTPQCAGPNQCQVGLSVMGIVTAKDAVTSGLAFPFVAVSNIVQGLGQLVTGQIPGGLLGSNGVTGPIGIAYVTEQSVSLGLGTYIFFVALLSVALGFTNLLPLLALDGRRVAVVLIEVLRRRPFDRNMELNFQRIGLVALIAIAVLISALDIQRIASGQFPGLQR